MTQILMPALSHNLLLVMARLDRATHSARFCALKGLYADLGGPLLRAMTIGWAE